MAHVGLSAPPAPPAPPAPLDAATKHAANSQGNTADSAVSASPAARRSRLEEATGFLDAASSGFGKVEGVVGTAVSGALSGVSDSLKMITSGRDIVSSVRAARQGNQSAGEKAYSWAEVMGNTQSFLTAAAGAAGMISDGANLIPDTAKLVLVAGGIVPLGVFGAIKVAPSLFGGAAWLALFAQSALEKRGRTLAGQSAGTSESPAGGNAPDSTATPPGPLGPTGSGGSLHPTSVASPTEPGTTTATNVATTAPSLTDPSPNILRSSTMISTNPETMRSVSDALTKFVEDIQTAKDTLQESVSNAADSWADGVYTHTDSTVSEILQRIDPSEECTSLAEHIDNKATALEEYNAG